MLNDINEITLRKAVLDDAEAIFIWRNAIDTRRYFFNSHAILWDEHLKWVSDALQKQDRMILVGEVGNNPIGILRYDFKENVTEVDIYLVPGLYGKGVGTNLLKAGNKWILIHMPNIKKVVAKVLYENIPSQKAFLKAGFKEFYMAYEYIINSSN